MGALELVLTPIAECSKESGAPAENLRRTDLAPFLKLEDERSLFAPRGCFPAPRSEEGLSESIYGLQRLGPTSPERPR